MQEWFRHHFYLAVLVATIMEGLGLPLPAEALFLAAAVLVHKGTATLPNLILVAAGGNMLGTMTGFALAYLGGKRLISRVSRLVGIKAESTHKYEEFFKRYGAVTVFLSRFVGVIRAATIYSAGAARMAPWKFAAYMLAATLIWNGAWAFVAYRFGRHLPRITHPTVARTAIYIVGVVAIFLLVQLTVRWYRRRNAMDS
ncbi:MAG TPA: DedA family protein [Symbiobacteriaceae bacterium]